MEIVCICNQKGGVGKTTTASALSAGLKRKGYRILAIDSDPQGNLTASIGINPDTAIGLDELYSQRNQLDDAIIRDTACGDFVPCSLSLADADKRFSQYAAFRMLKNMLSEADAKYDYCIIDSPPSLGILSINTLIAANKAIVPVNASAFSIQGISALMKTINEVKTDNHSLVVDGILLTRFNHRTRISKDVLEVLSDIAKEIGTKVYRTTIRQGVAIEAAQADKLDIFTSAPNSLVAIDYRHFINEFLGDHDY